MDLAALKKISMWQTCLTLGHFDGVHRGHQAVIDRLVKIGSERQLAPVLISFDHDEADSGTACLTSEAEKRLLLRNSGLRAMISVKPDDTDIADLLQRAVRQLDAKVIVAGENDCRLGLLRASAAKLGLDLITCDVVFDDGEPISSGRAANALDARDFQLLSRLLGHPYSICGEVVYGKQIGRTIALPTANISYVKNKHLPPEGSYGAVTFVSGVPHMGTANIGRRPTVDVFDYVTVENHLLDFSGDLYGQFLRMDLHVPIRGVSKFENLQELRTQVAKDILFVRSQLADILAIERERSGYK